MGAAGRAGGDGVSFWPSAPRPPRPWRPSHQRTPRASDDRVWRGRGPPVRLRVGSGAGGRAPSRLRPWAPLPAPALGIPGPRAPLQLPLTRRFHRRTALPRATGPLALSSPPRRAPRDVVRRRGAARAVAPGPMAGIGIWAGCSSARRPCLLSLGSWDGQVPRSHPRLLPSLQTCPETSLPSCTRPYPKSSCVGSPSTLPNLSGPLTSAPLTLSLTPVPSLL